MAGPPLGIGLGGGAARGGESARPEPQLGIGGIPFTPRANNVPELAQRESGALGHNYSGTEDILLGMLREGDGVAVQVLLKLGADVN